MRILLVEDDEALCAAVAPLLEQEGYRVDVCRDGDDALYYMRQRMFGLCILDRMLPGRDGLSVLRAARAEGLDTPVLMRRRWALWATEWTVWTRAQTIIW